MKKAYQVKKQRLWYPTSPTVLRKIRAGENPPIDKRGWKEVQVGEIVTDFPSESIKGLLDSGLIVEVVEGDADGELRES